MRPAVGAALAIALGFTATVVTGEFASSWGYVLVDVPLVALAAFLGLRCVQHIVASTGPSR